MDTNDFVIESIKEVVSTLVEAMILVFIVVYVFLQNWRATLIPCIAVPVSIIGTFAGLYAFGYTLNTDPLRHGAGHRHCGGRRHCGA